MKKRFLQIFLICAALCALLCVTAFAANIVDSGTCGDNLTWTLDDNGVLTISGTGAMTNYSDLSSSAAPWYSQRSSITSAVIENGVTSIGDYAFYFCTNLTNISIGGVTSIGNFAFCHCYNLTNISIRGRVTSIGNYAFNFCTSLTGVTIPDSVTSIGDYAFYGCTSLTSVTIPDSVTEIGSYAFYRCTSLTGVTIPDSVTSIGDRAFQECTSLRGIDVSANNSVYSSLDGVLFNKSKTQLIAYPIRGAYFTYTIPNSVTSIVDYAFYGCTSLMGVTIPDSVTEIGSSAFSGCTSLLGVTIPDSVTSIGNYAFSGCTRLTSVTIPDSVTEIGSFAFSRCTRLTSVTIPDSVTSIGVDAFSRCTSLENIIIPDSVTTIGSHAFVWCNDLTDIYYGGSAAQWNESCSEYGVGLSENVTIHYGKQDVGVGVILTDESGKTVDANGETAEKISETEYQKENAFVEGAEITAKVDIADADAVTSSKLVTANIFWVFYDIKGYMVHLQQSEIDLSDPLNIAFMENIRIPEGAKTMKILILSDELVPLRAARMIESSVE